MKSSRPDLRPRVLVSLWLLPCLVLGLVMTALIVPSVVLSPDPVARGVGIVMLCLTAALSIALMANTVLHIDRRGFHTLLHRRIPWQDVAMIRVREVPNWGRSTFALVIDRHADAEGAVRSVTLQGFGRPGRPEQLEALRSLMQSYRDATLGTSDRVSPLEDVPTA